MSKTYSKTAAITKTALIAALYVVLTLVFAPIAFSTVQFRVSEILTVLPVFTGLAVPGLSIGCCLANLLGVLLGTNPTGLIDAVFGTLATLLAAICTYYVDKLPAKLPKYLLAPLFPVLFNAVIVGMELTFVFGGEGSFWEIFLFQGISVGIGEAVVCYVGGCLLMGALYAKNVYKRIFAVDRM